MRILLTGGSACGKSTYAEGLALRLPSPRYYLATMRVCDDQSRGTVARHRQIREGKGFVTMERDSDIDAVTLPEHGTVLLECMCNLTANEMFDEQGNIRYAYDKILAGIEALEARCDALIVVTNDVGSDGGAYDGGTLEYVKTLGRLNRALAERFDCVYELVCGIPLVRKGRLV